MDDPIAEPLSQVQSLVHKVEAEQVSIFESCGRVLAESLRADRDSPPIDVSAMDGYAVQLKSLESEGTTELAVVATQRAGDPPVELPTGMAIRIFTGAAVPRGADAVVKREDTDEFENSVRIKLDTSAIASGLNIRRRGENLEAGEAVLSRGHLLDDVAMAAIATFGSANVQVQRKVRVVILNTGDELRQPGEAVEAWQIRDSNGLLLDAWMRRLPWLELVARQSVPDRLEATTDTMNHWLPRCECVIFTGGVSMGDTDFVPAAIENAGGKIVFHKLPIRPGKPVLGAVKDGKLILGLPGNPVSVAVTARIIADPLLRSMAGISPFTLHQKMRVVNADDRKLNLAWYRLVEKMPGGVLNLVASKGSGDLVSLARSDGFVKVPAGQSGEGPWEFTAW